MGQILHGCAKTTTAVRKLLQNSKESLKTLAKKYAINRKTVACILILSLVNNYKILKGT